jgi:hypothetical protein
MNKPSCGFITETVKLHANKVASALSADVLLINAEIERGLDEEVISTLHSRIRRKNVFLILITPGGDPNAAYRIARSLQDHYERFIAFISGYCKSAGTLCVLGANEIVMSDVGELGPLDVQLYKKDELGELSSGLVAVEALQMLQVKAFEMFEEYFLNIKMKSSGQITFKTATEIAMKMSTGLLEPLYRQIDPIHVGEMARSMKIATAYGERLMLRSNNYTEETLETLSQTYPSHGFVIDKPEVDHLFNNVRQPSVDEENLRKALGECGRKPCPEGKVNFLSDEIKGGKNENKKRTIKKNNINAKQRRNSQRDEKNPK